MTSPMVTAANSATWVGGVGQKVPPSLPPPRARDGEMRNPSTTCPSTIAIAHRWHLTRNRSFRPHHGVSSHRVRDEHREPERPGRTCRGAWLDHRGDRDLDDEQAVKAQVHARPDQLAPVHGQRDEQGERQGPLGDQLADRRGDRQDKRLTAPRLREERHHVEDKQEPGRGDQAAGRAAPPPRPRAAARASAGGGPRRLSRSQERGSRLVSVGAASSPGPPGFAGSGARKLASSSGVIRCRAEALVGLVRADDDAGERADPGQRGASHRPRSPRRVGAARGEHRYRLGRPGAQVLSRRWPGRARPP